MLLSRTKLLIFPLILLCLSLSAQQVFAQAMGINAGAGVVVTPDGVLSKANIDPTGRLTRQRFLAARSAARDAKRSGLRKVSLNRLEAAIQERLAAGEDVTDDMSYLAGLTRVEYVFFLPETNDVVIAGPAEPWFLNSQGEPFGIDSLRPILRLDDLVVALRAFPPGGRPATTTIGCSIDPTTEGLAAMQEFLRTVGPRARNVRFLVAGLRKAMGMQDVTIRGIQADSHFSVVMVSADYRMKLIGIGVEKPPIRIASYVDLARPSSRQNALVRWYFTPNYECVRMSDDGYAMQLVGEGVQLVGADEVVGADGVRHAGGRVDSASRKFVQGFTAKYADLAAKVPVYAQLRQLIDLTVVAAFIRQQDYYGKSGWNMDLLGDETLLPVGGYNPPKQVETVVTAVFKGNRLMTPVGGGVVMRPQTALTPDKLLPDEGGLVAERHRSIDVKDLPDGQWWWD